MIEIINNSLNVTIFKTIEIILYSCETFERLNEENFIQFECKIFKYLTF